MITKPINAQVRSPLTQEPPSSRGTGRWGNCRSRLTCGNGLKPRFYLLKRTSRTFTCAPGRTLLIPGYHGPTTAPVCPHRTRGPPG